MKVCAECGSNWDETGHTSPRPYGDGQYYYCRSCQTRKKPIEKIEALPIKVDIEIPPHTTITFPEENYTGNALIIGDVHLPFEHKDYLGFCASIRDKYKCDTIYSVGDFLDEHKMSFHDHDSDMPSAGDELAIAKEKLKDWYREFPVMRWCKGNHDERFYRVAYKAGIPKAMMKPLLEVLEAPTGWQYEDEFWINGETKVFHGTGFSGKYPHANAANENMCNVIIGHTHSVAGVHYKVTEKSAVWGLSVGCGIDRRKSAFQYAKNMARKPVLSCGVILNGKVPIVEIMDL